MNYLGHMLLTHERSEAFQFGAMAPDFAGMHKSKIISPDDQPVFDPPYADFYAGVAFHEQTDIVFDQNEKLLGVRNEFYKTISPRLKGHGFHQSLLLAKVGLDLLVDGAVQQHWPEVNTQYQRLMKNLGGVAAASVFDSPDSFDQMRPERAKHGPPDYANSMVVAGIIHWRVYERERERERKRLTFDKIQLPLVAEALEKYNKIIGKVACAAILETAGDLGVKLPPQEKP